MKSRNSKPLTILEAAHIANVKALPCSVCDAPGPSDAHHPEQQRHFCVIALCKECHQGSLMGIHGQRRAWAIAKMGELDALNVTIRRLME